MPNPQGPEARGIALGTLAITLLARTKAFRDGMSKAINALKKFNEEASRQKAAFAGIAKAVTASVQQTTKVVTDGAKQTQSAMSAVGKQYKASSQQVQASGKQTRVSIQQTASTADKAGKQMMSRGKQQLGAILSFQEGVAKFIKLNVRWFVVWRSFWFLWSKLQEALANINVLMHETSLALRTSTDAMRNEVELLVKRNALTREAIRFTAQHTKSLRDYVKSFYYLTTAGLSFNVAQETIGVTMKTAIALDEDAIATTRTMTSLYNVFGKTLTGVRTPVEKMQKISAILTATFRKQDIEMADYNKAMTYVGALSKTAGIDLETLVASLGVLGTHFVKSSKGGTALARTFARLLKYPERLAAATGIAFDPSKPLQFEMIMREVGRTLREGTLDTEKLGISVKLAGDMIELFGLRGIRVITLAENFEKLADQIKANREATFDLVDAMVELVESDPSAQLKILGNAVSMNVVAMVRGAAQTQTFSGQLASLNKILLKAIGLSEDLGRAVGILLGSLEKIPAALIAWRLASTKAAAPTSALGKWIQSVGLSLLVMWRALFKTKQGVMGFGTAIGLLLKKFAALGTTLKGAGLALGKFAGWFGVIIAAMDVFFVAWDMITGKFTKKSKQFAFEEVAIQKGMLSKLLSYLSLRNLSYRIANYKLMGTWKRARDVHAKGLDQQGLTEVEHAQKMQEFMIRWWSNTLGIEEMQLKKRMGLITDADERLMGERVRIEGEIQQEIQKLRLSGLENQLYILDQRIMVMKTKEADATLIETYFALKRRAIFSKYLKGLTEKYDKTYDSLWQITKTSLDKQLEDSRGAGVELEKLYAQQLLTRIRMQYETGSKEADVISHSMKMIEDETLGGINALNLARIQATHYGLDELSKLLAKSAIEEKGIRISRAAAELRIEKEAFEALDKLVKKQIDFRHGKLIAGSKNDLDILKQNYEKRREAIINAAKEITKSMEASQELQTKTIRAQGTALTALAVQNEIERSGIVEFWAKKRADALAKIDFREYTRTETAWLNLTKKISDIHQRHLGIIEKQRAVSTEKEISDEEERRRILADLDEKEKESEGNRDKALLKLKIKEASEYFKYLLKLKKKEIEEIEQGDQRIADSSNRAWLTIMAGMADASEDYLNQIGDLSDSVKRIFGRFYQDLESVISSSLQKMTGLEAEYSRESLDLIAERNEEQRRSLKEQLEEGRINRTRYYAELDELDRKFIEEIENRRRGFVKNMSDLWKSLRVTALGEFSKLVVGIIADQIKAIAAEKGLTRIVIGEEITKGLARLWSWFTKLGPIGMIIGTAVAAAFVAKMTGLIKFAKGGIIKKRTSAIIGEEGPEAVIPLERKAGRLILSERGREILQPLLGFEETIPSLLRSAAQTEGLIRLSPEATATLGARTALQKTEQKVEIGITFQGDTIDFSGSVPMINDLSTIDKVYEEVWLPAKQRRIERLKEIIGEAIE